MRQLVCSTGPAAVNACQAGTRRTPQQTPISGFFVDTIAMCVDDKAFEHPELPSQPELASSSSNSSDVAVAYQPSTAAAWLLRLHHVVKNVLF